MKNIKIFLVPSSDAVMGDMTGVRDFFRQLNESKPARKSRKILSYCDRDI